MREPTHKPPEKMADFFNARSAGYDDHMQRTVSSFATFYSALAEPVPLTDSALDILDIGCGTGLELGYIWARAPHARITGIDVSAKMLAELKVKYISQLGQIELIEGSYLDQSFGVRKYDFVVSVMTLHHLLPAQKISLYKRIHRALKPGGAYVEGDYVVSEDKERQFLAEYASNSKMLADSAAGAYHIDIPLSLHTQRKLLAVAGYEHIKTVWQEGEAAVLVATVK